MARHPQFPFGQLHSPSRGGVQPPHSGFQSTSSFKSREDEASGEDEKTRRKKTQEDNHGGGGELGEACSWLIRLRRTPPGQDRGWRRGTGSSQERSGCARWKGTPIIHSAKFSLTNKNKSAMAEGFL